MAATAVGGLNVISGATGAFIIHPNFEAEINENARGTFNTIAVNMEQFAKLFVPVATGKLQASIQGKVRGRGKDMFMEVSASEEYALFVEYGTGTRGRATQHQSIYESLAPFKGVGRPAEYVHGSTRKGVRAQPYLRPAMIAAAKVHLKLGG